MGAGTSLAILSLVCLALLGCDRDGQVSRREFESMGTVARVEIFHSDRTVAGVGIRAVEGVFDSVNALMSTWDANSEISQLNKASAGRPLPQSQWLSDCLSHAEDMRAASGGAFDPTAEPLMRLWGFYRREGRLPSVAQIDSARSLIGGYRHDRRTRIIIKDKDGTSFDLGGIAKGYALDRAAEVLHDLSIENALIDLGGNLVCIGAPPGRETWRVGIRDPRDRDRLFAVMETSGRALSTSGSYERYVVIDGRRYGHIMNPVTGKPAEGLLSVTVLASTGTLADGLSTALFVLGYERGRDLLSRTFPDVEAVFVLPSRGADLPKVLASEDLDGRLALRSEYRDLYTLEFF